MPRKKKLIIAQLSLVTLGFLIIILTYFNNNEKEYDQIVSTEKQKKIKERILKNNEGKQVDAFYNIQYSGLDLEGNRYILKSLEAYNSERDQSQIDMISVEASFFFKDNTVLKVFSEKGMYNNKNQDMVFNGNVKAFYEGSELFADKAEYSNSKSYLIISENVKVNDVRGSIYADELLFDIKKRKLNIVSTDKKKVNANINLK
jgi:lipopolysaccharide assembly outer membrane protein LptD (OstA)